MVKQKKIQKHFKYEEKVVEFRRLAEKDHV